MITKVSENNILDAAKIYMYSWRESHKDICSAEFVEKHDFEYMLSYIKGKINSKYDIFINYNNKEPVGIIGINPADEEICLLYILPKEQERASEQSFLNSLFQNVKILI